MKARDLITFILENGLEDRTINITSRAEDYKPELNENDIEWEVMSYYKNVLFYLPENYVIINMDDANTEFVYSGTKYEVKEK